MVVTITNVSQINFSIVLIKKMSSMDPSSLEASFDPLDGVCKRTGCITSSGVCMNRFQTLAFNSGTCKRQPKPASTFTDLGFSFSSRSSGRHTATSGVLDTRSSNCTVIKRREAEGLAKFGSYGVYPEGPKPPIWLMTGETVGNKPVKVFLRVSELDTIEADELPLTNAQLESFDLLGLFVGTGECGLGRQACNQKCYVTGTGCRVKNSDSTAGGTTVGCSCAPCCCPSGEIRDASAGCDFSYQQDCLWEGLHLTRLDSNLKAVVLNQLVQLLAGVNTGWQVAEVDPQIVDPVDFNPGNLLGLYQWNKDLTGSRLSSLLAGSTECPSIRLTPSEAASSSLAIKGLVALGPEYNDQTSFRESRLGVVVDLGSATSQYYLAVVTIYSPVMTGLSPLPPPQAGNRLCCLFEDSVVDSSGDPDCQPVLSYLSMIYGFFEGGDYFDFSIDNVVLSITDEARFVMAYETAVTGTSTGTPRTMYLGDQAFTVTPYSVLNIAGLAIEAVGSDATPISLAVGAQGPLPLTSAQVSAWGNLFVKVLRMDNSFNFAEFSVFRRTGLDRYTLPSGPVRDGSLLFFSSSLVNTDPSTVYTVDLSDSDLEPTYAFRPPPASQNATTTEPKGYGFSQYTMTAAAVAVSNLETVAFRLAFENSSDGSFVDETWEFRINPISDALSATLSFSYNKVLPTVTQEVTVQDRQISSFILNEGGAAQAAFQIVMAVYQGDWVVQLTPCLFGGVCDTALFDSFP